MHRRHLPQAHLGVDKTASRMVEEGHVTSFSAHAIIGPSPVTLRAKRRRFLARNGKTLSAGIDAADQVMGHVS
jgi:hypothetical protein